MDQAGSSSAKSPSNPSNQRGMSFSDELAAIVNSSQDFSMERETRYSNPETREYRPIGPSFSRDPLQFHGGNTDLSAGVYVNPREQFFRTRGNMMVSGEEAPEYYDDGMMNTYNLLSSNLPPEYMSRGVHIGSSQTLVPFESSTIDPSTAAIAYWAAQAQNIAMVPENSMRPMRNQGIPYQTNDPSGFELGNVISPTPLRPRLQNTIDQLAEVAVQNYIAQNVDSSFPRSIGAQGVAYPMPMLPPGNNEFDGGSSINNARLKRKMPLEDDATPGQQGWSSSGRGFQRYSSSSSSNGGSYTLYDKRYEELGLPVDPHLRIFVAANGNGESSSKRKD